VSLPPKSIGRLARSKDKYVFLNSSYSFKRVFGKNICDKMGGECKGFEEGQKKSNSDDFSVRTKKALRTPVTVKDISSCHFQKQFQLAEQPQILIKLVRKIYNRAHKKDFRRSLFFKLCRTIFTYYILTLLTNTISVIPHN